MKWYAAHAIMYVEFKGGRQTEFPVWENVLLVGARSVGEAMKRARRRAREDTGDARGSMVWDGRPARWRYGGIRKLIECQSPEDRPQSGTEITYSEFLVKGRDGLRKLTRGDAMSVRYCE